MMSLFDDIFQDLAGRLAVGGAMAPFRRANPQERVPHTRQRLAMESDPALAALLPGSPARFAIGDRTCAPFYLKSSGLILLPPVLFDHPAAMAITTRWSMLTLEALEMGHLGERKAVAILRHAASLLEGAPPKVRQLLQSLVPAEVAATLSTLKNDGQVPRIATEWLASRIENTHLETDARGPLGPLELELPLEMLLVAGGDGRLVVNESTGLNRYGVCPRPRPEAVHFSSSTASAISEHGFLLADYIRRDLLLAALNGTDPRDLRRKLVFAISQELLRLLGVSDQEAEVVTTPSGTDAELLTILLAAAGASGRPVTSILMAPEESGKGVVLAGAGKYFDDVAATGAPVKRGQNAVEGLLIQTREIAIRDDSCKVRHPEATGRDLLALGRAALSEGHHVLVHVLLGSKTGVYAPDLEFVETLVREAPDRVDVVVDACQMRSEFAVLGDLVRRGWILQISGSKFLTGPPFSGAMLVPAKMLERIANFSALLQRAKGVGHAADWGPVWSEKLPHNDENASFGALFRWLPALLEAQLYLRVPDAIREHATERFRSALLPRILSSRYIQPLDPEIAGALPYERADWLARLSIISFEVLGKTADGHCKPLNETQCTWLFQHLNRDVSPLFENLSEVDRVTARQPCHIGQPVVLHGVQKNLAYLRLVLGARFFNIVAYAPGGSMEAALESEISDAIRVVEKIELLAANFAGLEEAAQRRHENEGAR